MTVPCTSTRRMLLSIAFMLILGLIPARLWAATISIEAVKMTIYHKTNRVIFTQKVHLIREDFELYCDRMVVYYTDKDIDHAEAFGHVRLHHGKARGTSDKAVLNQSKNTLTLIGNAVLEQDSNRVTGDQIIHDMNTDKTVILPVKGGRTHMTIESGDNNGQPLSGPGKK